MIIIKTFKNKKNNRITFFIITFVILSFGLAIWYSRAPSNNISFFYDFEDDEIGNFPKHFLGIGRSTKYVKVIEWTESDLHYKSKVVEINYFKENIINPFENYGGSEFNILFKHSEKGIIEFDIYIQNPERINIDICQEDVIYNINDDIVIRIPLSYTEKGIYVRNRFGGYKEIQYFRIQKWYHIKIEFNLENWKIWIDNSMNYKEFMYNKRPEYFCQLYFATYILGQVFY
ncbi:hypothetical protein LCGC14_1458070, partial [marine sediment metagenome]